MGADAPEDAQRIAALLPAGTPVYVNHLPRRALAHTLPALIALAEAGLEPVPHVAARRIASRAEAEAFLKQAVRLAGVRKVLLIGGDVPEPLGPYADGAALMRDGLLSGCGVQQVGLPGYPEGHPRIAQRHARRRARRQAGAGRGAGPRRPRRHPVLVRAQPHRRVLRRPRAARARRAGLRRPAGPDQPAHAAALRPALRGERLACARCRRRAWARCASSPTSTPPTS